MALVVLVVIALQPGWHSTLSGEDFPGHVALLTTFLARLGAPDWLPLWTSDLSSGTSLLLPYLHPIGSLLLLSPFTLVFGPELGLRVGDTFFLALAALSMFVWCRSLGVSPLAGYLGGLFYALHPVVFIFLGRSGQVHQPVTMAVVPLAFLAFRRLAKQPGVPALLMAALATSALALDMQRFWLLLPFVLLAYLASESADGKTGLARVGSRVAWAAAAGLCSALLLCFPVLPALLERPELMGHPDELLEGYRKSFALPHLLALLDRDAWLSGLSEGSRAARSGILAGASYQGLVPVLLLAFGALLSLRGRERARLRAALALVMSGAAGAIVLAMGTRPLLGQHLKIAREFLDASPGVVPWAALLLVALCAALGLVLTVIAARERWPERSGIAAAAVVATALLLGAITPFVLLASLPLYAEVRGPAHFTFPLLPFLLGTGASLVLPLVSRRVPAIAIVALLTLLHGVDLLPYRDMLRPSRSAAEEDAMRAAFGRLSALPPGRAVTSEDYEPLGESLALLEGHKPAAWSWIAWATRAHTADLLRVGGFGPLEVARRGVGVGAAEFAARSFGLANVRYVVRSGPDAAAVPDDPAFVKRVDEGGVQIFENARALAFAQFYPRLALISGTTQEVDTAMVMIAYSGVATYALDAETAPPETLRFDYAEGLHARAVAPSAPSLARLGRQPAGPPPTMSPCEVTRGREPEIVLACEFTQTGYLVVAESWSPDWEARVDGEVRALHRLNVAFQGLRVAPGDHEIRIRHTLSSAGRLGLFVSTASWAGLLAWALLRRRRGSR
jgi:hypothetical protein